MKPSLQAELLQRVEPIEVDRRSLTVRPQAKTS